jgi:hypothetical protein
LKPGDVFVDTGRFTFDPKPFQKAGKYQDANWISAGSQGNLEGVQVGLCCLLKQEINNPE